MVQLRAVMGQWLPLGRNVLRTVVEQLPSAAGSQAARLPHLCPELSDLSSMVNSTAAEGSASADPSCGAVRGISPLRSLRLAIERCDAGVDAPVLLQMTKVYSVGCSDPTNELLLSH